MEKEIWQSDQPVLQSDLVLAQSSKEDAITKRQTDEFNYGVVTDSGVGNPFAITVNPLTAPNYTISIGAGVAYDVNGQRIEIATPLVAWIDPTLPASTTSSFTRVTDNGIGGFVATPISTGSLSVGINSILPLTTAAVSYIYVTYVNTIDPSVFTLSEGNNSRLFIVGTDGYRIDVVSSGTTVGNPVTFLPFPDSVFLGVVDTSRTLSISSRPVFGLVPDNLLAVVPPPSQTLNALSLPYAIGQSVNFDTHVSGIGTGTVTAKNVHGLSIADITGTFTGLTINQALQLFMESGITGDQTSTTSALYGTPVAGSGGFIPPTYGKDQFLIKALLPTEAVLINGNIASSTTITQDYLVYFLDASGNLLDDGNYTVFLNSSTMAIQLAYNGSVPANMGYRVYGIGTNTFTNGAVISRGAAAGNPNNFLLWSVTWVGGPSGPGIDNFTSWTDLRLFGTINGNSLRRDALTDTVTIPHNVSVIVDPLVVGTGNFSAAGTGLFGGNVTIGGTVGINGVPYTWPSTQGAASSVLTDNGAGVLTWSAPSGSSIAQAPGPWFATPTGSRTTGTTYTNNTNRPIFLNVIFSGGSNGNVGDSGTITMGTPSSPTVPSYVVAVAQSLSAGSAAPSFTLTAFIPVGYAYSLSAGNISLSNVTEWQ